jgi:hypothetical protein
MKKVSASEGCLDDAFTTLSKILEERERERAMERKLMEQGEKKRGRGRGREKEDGRGYPLHEAVKRGNIDLALNLLDDAFDPNELNLVLSLFLCPPSLSSFSLSPSHFLLLSLSLSLTNVHPLHPSHITIF